MGDVDATETTPTDTGGSENEDFMPFLEARGWKIVTIILLAYWAIRALGWIVSWMYYFCRYCKCFRQGMQAKDRMAKLYNQSGGAWAVVSGGSDGIGLEMCHQLAAQGFNVCIVARNAKKIDEKLGEIKAKYPSIETKSIIADFTKLFTIEEYKTNIADHCQDMDVAIFALNAGITRIGFYDGIPDMDVQDNVMCNALHPCYLAKAITPMMTGRMDKKKQKSAMIFVSSMAQDVPAPGNLTYSAAKIFCSYIAEGLSYEFEGKVDVINYMPAVVKTNIFKPEDME